MVCEDNDGEEKKIDRYNREQTNEKQRKKVQVKLGVTTTTMVYSVQRQTNTTYGTTTIAPPPPARVAVAKNLLLALM